MNDEKHVAGAATQTPDFYSSDESNTNKEFDVPEDVDGKKLKWAYRKVDATLLFILFLSNVLNSMDRANLGLSKVAGLEKDLGLKGSDFNVIASIMYPTYLVCMLPSNLALRKFGARFWLSLITVVWGLINMCMAFAKNRTDMILCRLFLGAAESGAAPGALMLISLWYPRHMVTSRVALFYSAFAAGAIIGGPIAAGIGKMTNPRFNGWEWIFFIEGLVTAGFGLLMYVFLADYPNKSWTMNNKEKALIGQNMALDQIDGGHRPVSYKRLLQHACDPLIYSQALILFTANFGVNTILTFSAIIVKNLGYDAGASQALQAAPGICGFIGCILSRYYPRFFGNHYRSSLFCSAWVAVASIILLSTRNSGANIFALCILSFGSFGNVSMGPGWLMSNVGGPTRGALGGAMNVICGGLGGLCTSYIYRNKDAPNYMFGHGMNLFAALLAFITATISYVIIVRRNKFREAHPIDISNMSEDEVKDLETDHPNFRFVE
ncbi:major facilitator superfamily domain-containing protein [Kickxella alabastrina]|uniref:major facilitator superfamily domain-containing protein n=1 Tax=Kickxella alabastrina TaxID=61397 RepID=UPI002220EA18|nr:major facilitator superfamily domain-containing protein [Kickxella alabastrina]KAI7825085.1 major facilitator superfamily domain-containing protein [Kickxella alabastrina]